MVCSSESSLVPRAAPYTDPVWGNEAIIYLLFVVGFPVLIYSADWLVDGASSVARRFGVSDLVVGLTIVAFGTSAPELAISTVASLQGNSGVILGNVFGSNIANIWLILGCAGLIYPLSVHREVVIREIPYALLAVLVLGVLANDRLLRETSASQISTRDSLVLLGFFVILMYYTATGALRENRKNKSDGARGLDKTRKDVPPPDLPPSSMTLFRAGLKIAVGMGGLVVGGQWLMDGAVAIAGKLGASEKLIGLTIIAIGTSLPELATSCMAAIRRNTDIAVGNVVGSNIFNILLVLGVSAVIRPLPFDTSVNPDLLVVVIATVMLFVMLFWKTKHELSRATAGLFLLCYFSYITYAVMKG